MKTNKNLLKSGESRLLGDKHIDGLRILLFYYSIDIITINETKLDDIIKSCECRWFSRYVIAAILMDSKQKIAH